MEGLSGILFYVCAGALIVLFVKLIKLPIRWAFKLLLHALIGFVGLYVLNFFGSAIGVSLEMTWLNALITGVLGIPGVVLLLLVKYLL